MTAQTRLIRTDYYFQGKVIKQTRSVHPNNATRNCFDHMQMNNYGAEVAEVHDENTGTLHAVFAYTKAGELVTVFKRKVKADYGYGTRRADTRG